MQKQILIVDDSPSLRQAVVIALRNVGYGVLEAGSGVDALAVLDRQKVHLVISDVNMPVMDGLRLLENIKTHATHRVLPVMMLTTESQPEKLAQAKAAGARAWVMKPFRPEQLVDAVTRLVR